MDSLWPMSFNVSVILTLIEKINVVDRNCESLHKVRHLLNLFLYGLLIGTHRVFFDTDFGVAPIIQVAV